MAPPHSESVDSIFEVLEEVLSLKSACSDHCKESSREEFPFMGLVAEANFSPLDPRSYCLLGSVVRRFDAFMFEEGEKMIPTLQHTAGVSGHVDVRRGFVRLQTPINTRSKRDRLQDKSFPVETFASESIEECEHSTDFGKHPTGVFNSVRTAA
jgi:hypothetical protein